MPKPQPKKTRITLRVDLAGSEPPTEFRVFTAGVNKTSKGDFLFDDEAAKAVMSEYRQHGVDVMIDLEHLSLDSESNNYDPSAYGWCKLELRNGELWAVNVSWTEAGATRLRKRLTRYISPAFHFLADSLRITEIYNIAICAVPATYETPALVAASKRVGKQIGTLTIEVTKMDEIKKCAAALGLKDDATLEDVLNAIKALQDGDGGGEEEEEAADDPDGDEDDKDQKKKDAEMAAAIKDLPPMVQARILAATSSSKAMQERLDRLERDHLSVARETLIAANAKKLPKSLEAWARKQPIEALAEYFKNAVPVERETSAPPRHVTGKKGKTVTEEGEGEVTLTKADKELCRQTGKTHAQMIELKKARLAKDAENAERGGRREEDEDAA